MCTRSIMKGWTNDDRMMIACCNDGTRAFQKSNNVTKPIWCDQSQTGVTKEDVGHNRRKKRDHGHIVSIQLFQAMSKLGKLLAGLFLFPYPCYNIPTLRNEVFPMSSKNDRNSKNDDKKNDPIMIHMATGMSVGMCLGLALGFALQSDNMPPTIFMLFGMSIGMSLGLAIGSMKKKRGNDKEKK